MLDQNTTTIITTAITAVSTLLAAILGVFLANRHNEKQEKLQAIQRGEEKKKNAIEEAYEITIKIDSLCDAFVYVVINGSDHPGEGINRVERIQEIRSTSDRLKTLINLYLPSLRTNSDTYLIKLGIYWNAIGKAYSPGLKSSAEKSQDMLKTEQIEYKSSLKTLQKNLEEAVA